MRMRNLTGLGRNINFKNLRCKKTQLLLFVLLTLMPIRSTEVWCVIGRKPIAGT